MRKDAGRFTCRPCADSRNARRAACLGRPILKYRPIPSCNRSSRVHAYLRLWIRPNPSRLVPSEKPSGPAELPRNKSARTGSTTSVWCRQQRQNTRFVPSRLGDRVCESFPAHTAGHNPNWRPLTCPRCTPTTRSTWRVDVVAIFLHGLRAVLPPPPARGPAAGLRHAQHRHLRGDVAAEHGAGGHRAGLRAVRDPVDHPAAVERGDPAGGGLLLRRAGPGAGQRDGPGRPLAGRGDERRCCW